MRISHIHILFPQCHVWRIRAPWLRVQWWQEANPNTSSNCFTMCSPPWACSSSEAWSCRRSLPKVISNEVLPWHPKICTLESWRKSSRQSSNHRRKPKPDTGSNHFTLWSCSCRSCRRSLPQRKSSPPKIWNLYTIMPKFLLWRWHVSCANSGNNPCANFQLPCVQVEGDWAILGGG